MADITTATMGSLSYMNGTNESTYCEGSPRWMVVVGLDSNLNGELWQINISYNWNKIKM